MTVYDKTKKMAFAPSEDSDQPVSTVGRKKQLVQSFNVDTGVARLKHRLIKVLARSVYILQGSHMHWKSWKITKKSSMHGKIMEFGKKLNNHGKIMEFCEII